MTVIALLPPPYPLLLQTSHCTYVPVSHQPSSHNNKGERETVQRKREEGVGRKTVSLPSCCCHHEQRVVPLFVSAKPQVSYHILGHCGSNRFSLPLVPRPIHPILDFKSAFGSSDLGSHLYLGTSTPSQSDSRTILLILILLIEESCTPQQVPGCLSIAKPNPYTATSPGSSGTIAIRFESILARCSSDRIHCHCGLLYCIGV